MSNFRLFAAATVFAAVAVAVIIAAASATSNDQNRAAFQGACQWVGGTPSSDLCIRDLKVIFTRKQFEERVQ